MKGLLLNLHRQITDALKIGKAFSLSASSNRQINKIIFCGMGGSAIGGDILRRLEFQKDRIPFVVNRFSAFPKWIDPRTLAIFSSYSGNTQEVLEALEKALKAKASVLLMTSGGRLLEVAAKKKVPCIRIPEGLPPRFAVGYMTFALIPILNRLGLISVKKSDITETLGIVKHPKRALAKKVAQALSRRIVRFYGVTGIMEPVLVRWCSQLAENAKTLASYQVMPEMFHNEIEGWHLPASFIRQSTAVFFKDISDPEWILKKSECCKKMMRHHGAKVLEVASQGRSALARIFSLIVLGDWVSFELARIYRIDPLKIPHIEQIKQLR